MKQKPTAFTRSFSVAAAVILSAAPARAVLFDSTGDPAFNTTAPTGALAGSGWQYQGIFGGFLATPIAPNYFLAAKHIGGLAGATLSFGGNVFTTDSFVDSGNSDLRIWHVATPFSTYAPLYTGSNVTGRDLVFFGRGNERGADVTLSGNLIGWSWNTTSPNLERWGTNVVTGKVDLGASYGSTIFAEFNHAATRGMPRVGSAGRKGAHSYRGLLAALSIRVSPANHPSSDS